MLCRGYILCTQISLRRIELPSRHVSGFSDLLYQNVIPALQNLTVFLQDGAPPHLTLIVRSLWSASTRCDPNLQNDTSHTTVFMQDGTSLSSFVRSLWSDSQTCDRTLLKIDVFHNSVFMQNATLLTSLAKSLWSASPTSDLTLQKTVLFTWGDEAFIDCQVTVFCFTHIWFHSTGERRFALSCVQDESPITALLSRHCDLLQHVITAPKKRDYLHSTMFK